MAKKLLLAIDDSENAIRAVEFVANTFTTDSRITLFNVVQDTATMCEMNSPELTPYFTSQQSSFCLLEEKKKSWLLKLYKKVKPYSWMPDLKKRISPLKQNLKKTALQEIL